VSASILRVDGDSGAVTGAYDGHTFVLGHFSGARPLRLELTPTGSATLRVELDSYDTYTAIRTDEARARGLPEPTDPTRFTSVKDPGAAFEFSFPDLDGHIVSNTDARFRRKVVIVSIGGSWCPNCHDEAPFLMELYRKYRDRGLEIVFLSFEEAKELKSLRNCRRSSSYDVEYQCCRRRHEADAITTAQIVNLSVSHNAVPRPRRVGSGVHAGFASTATGRYHTSLKADCGHNRASSRRAVSRLRTVLAERAEGQHGDSRGGTLSVRHAHRRTFLPTSAKFQPLWSSPSSADDIQIPERHAPTLPVPPDGRVAVATHAPRRRRSRQRQASAGRARQPTTRTRALDARAWDIDTHQHRVGISRRQLFEPEGNPLTCSRKATMSRYCCSLRPPGPGPGFCGMLVLMNVNNVAR
jgi:thiol-disulfide isomerase/thioredoxin